MGRADLTEGLAQFARGLVPEGVALDVMRLSLLDWAAVGLAGVHEPVSQILRSQAEDEGGTEQASLIGASLRIPARMAALVNGTTSHALDYDDTHFAHIGHPSVAVIPAVLAVGEMTGADGRALQEAALIGAEASIRIGVWLGRSHYQIGYHQTGTAGAFGAALGAGRLLNLTEPQMMQAIGLVATRASGVKAQFGTMGKPMNAGIAASNGVEAALLASKGFVSAPDALDGQNGFGPTHHGAGDVTAFDGLGTTWMFPKVQHKFHACCHGLHAALEALKGVTISPDRIQRIEIATHPRWMTVCNIATPRTGLEAKFSYRMTAALALSGYDTARLDTFEDALCDDPGLTDLRDKVEVAADDSLTEMQARVRVLGGGQSQDLAHDLDADLGLEARQDRVRAKAASLLGQSRADTLWHLISNGASAVDLAASLRD